MKKYLFIISGIIFVHLLISVITISYFPKINIEEPGYTASGNNLSIKGERINEIYKDLNWTNSYKAYWDKIETFPPLYPYLLNSYLKIFSYNLIPLRFLSVFGGLILLFVFGALLKKIFKNNIVFILSLILTMSFIFRYVTQQARPDIWVSLSSLLSLFLLVGFIGNKKMTNLLFASFFASIAFLFHLSGAIVLGGYFLTLFILFIKKEISFKQLLICTGICFIVILPYTIFIVNNFYYFKVQVLNYSANEAVLGGFSWVFSKPEGLLIILFLAAIGIMSVFIMKKNRLINIISIYYLCTIFIGFFLQIKIRYTLIFFPMSLIISALFLQSFLNKYRKDKFISLFLIFILMISSLHLISDIIKKSKKENSYWSIMKQINNIVPNYARIIGHPDFQWGIVDKNITITECDDPNRLLSPLESYDFVIANELWQKRMLGPNWTPEIMSKLSLIFSKKNEIYNYKVYKIDKTIMNE